MIFNYNFEILGYKKGSNTPLQIHPFNIKAANFGNFSVTQLSGYSQIYGFVSPPRDGFALIRIE